MTRPIVLLTDFGWRDTYVGQVKAVIAGIAPGASVIDLTHDVEPYAIEHGAWLLETSLAAVPDEAVVLCVVDPGVGTARRGIAVQTGGRVFVGPDNGVLSAAYPEVMRRKIDHGQARLANGLETRELDNRALHRQRVSATFHGRDIFGPVAAHLAAGMAFAEVGSRVDEVTCLPPFEPGPDGEASIVHIDRYGNLITTIPGRLLDDRASIEVGQARVTQHVSTFGEAPRGELVMHRDSSGFVAIAQVEGRAAATLGVQRGDRVRLVSP